MTVIGGRYVASDGSAVEYSPTMSQNSNEWAKFPGVQYYNLIFFNVALDLKRLSGSHVDFDTENIDGQPARHHLDEDMPKSVNCFFTLDKDEIATICNSLANIFTNQVHELFQ